MKKKIIGVLLAVVLVASGLGSLAYAQVNGHEPMTGQKLVGMGEIGTLGDIAQVFFSVWFTNPDCVSQITIDRASIIRGDGEAIFEGKLSELPFDFGDVLKPHQTIHIPLFLCMPDGSGGWLSPGEALALPHTNYTVEIFYSVSQKGGLPLIGRIDQSVGSPGASGDMSMWPMVNMEQKLRPAAPPGPHKPPWPTP